MTTEEEAKADAEWDCVACALWELGQTIAEGGEVLSVSLEVPCPDGKARSLAVAAPSVAGPSVDGLPVLFIRRRDRVHSFVWCPVCEAEHAHGQGEGHRIAHCPPGSPFAEHGYLIRKPSE